MTDLEILGELKRMYYWLEDILENAEDDHCQNTAPWSGGIVDAVIMPHGNHWRVPQAPYRAGKEDGTTGGHALAKVREQITAPAQFLAQSERQVDDAAGQRTDCQLDGKEGSGIGAVHTLRFQHLGQGSHMRIKLVGKQQKVNGRANHDESGRADQSCQIITPMAFEAGP